MFDSLSFGRTILDLFACVCFTRVIRVISADKCFVYLLVWRSFIATALYLFVYLWRLALSIFFATLSFK